MSLTKSNNRTPENISTITQPNDHTSILFDIGNVSLGAYPYVLTTPVWCASYSGEKYVEVPATMHSLEAYAKSMILNCGSTSLLSTPTLLSESIIFSGFISLWTYPHLFIYTSVSSIYLVIVCKSVGCIGFLWSSVNVNKSQSITPNRIASPTVRSPSLFFDSYYILNALSCKSVTLCFVYVIGWTIPCICCIALST